MEGLINPKLRICGAGLPVRAFSVSHLGPVRSSGIELDCLRYMGWDDFSVDASDPHTCTLSTPLGST